MKKVENYLIFSTMTGPWELFCIFGNRKVRLTARPDHRPRSRKPAGLVMSLDLSLIVLGPTLACGAVSVAGIKNVRWAATTLIVAGFAALLAVTIKLASASAAGL